MNINAINPVLLRNKIMKSSELKEQPVPTDEPVSKPEEVMNVLNAKAANNIAFQGIQTSKLVKIGKKTLLPLIAAAGLAMATTSCNPEDYMPKPTDIDVTVNVENNIDMSAIIALLQQLFEQGKINQEQQKAWQKEMLALAQALVDGQITQTQYLEDMVRIQTAMLEEVAKNTANGEAILDKLDQIKEQYEKGQITLQQYAEELKALLGSIDGKLGDIYERLGVISEQITEFHNDFIDTRDSLYTNMNTIIEQNKLNGEAIERFHESFKNLEKDVAGIRANTDSLVVIASDTTKHKELIQAIEDSKSEPIDYAKFEAMFETYGIDIEEVITMSAGELKEFLTEWKEQDLAYDEKQVSILGDILLKMDKLSTQPSLELDGVIEAINKFQEQYLAGNTDVLEELGDISDKLDEIDASIDAIYDKLGSVSDQLADYHEIYVENWNETNKLLLSNNLTLDSLKTEQQITNKKLDALSEKADTTIALMQEFIDKGYGNFSMTEFIKFMKEYGEDNIKNLRALFIEMGLDKLDENTAVLKDYKTMLEQILQSSKDNGAKLDRIIELIEQLLEKDYTLNELKIVIAEVLEKHECNCNCGDGNHEGILDDIEDKLNGLV